MVEDEYHPGDATTRPEDQPLFASMLESFMAWNKTWAAGTEGGSPASLSATSEADSKRTPGVSELVLQASFELMASNIRAWQRFAEMWITHAPAFTRSLANRGSDGDAKTQEDFFSQVVAVLREGADVLSDESRRLLSILEDLFNKERSLPPDERTGQYWRRHRVKE